MREEMFRLQRDRAAIFLNRFFRPVEPFVSVREIKAGRQIFGILLHRLLKLGNGLVKFPWRKSCIAASFRAAASSLRPMPKRKQPARANSEHGRESIHRLKHLAPADELANRHRRYRSRRDLVVGGTSSKIGRRLDAGTAHVDNRFGRNT